jgi:hypothetical protein
VFIGQVCAAENKNVNTDSVLLCGDNEQSRKLAQIIIYADTQQRKELVCNEELAEIAYLKAKALAKKDKIQQYVSKRISHSKWNKVTTFLSCNW